MTVLTIDFETYYDRDFSLSKLTTEEYVRDPRFETIGVSVKEDDGPAQWFSGTKKQTGAWLHIFDWDNSVAVAHNAVFDMAILNWRYDIRPKRIIDTLSMARALGHGSVSLKALAEFYKLGVKGTEVVNALGKQRLDFTAEDLAAYGDYCRNDADLTYALFSELGDGFPLNELKLIDLTIRMFTEPVLELDVVRLEEHLLDVKEKKASLMSKMLISKEQLMSNPRLANVLRSLGVEPPMKTSLTTGKETYAFAKNDEEFKALLEHENAIVQAVVAARLGVKSTLEETRTERFIGIAERGSLPIPLRYYAAHTGRWGGDDKVNMQNLPRTSPLKKAILAPGGYVFIDSDSSQIEARTLAWLAWQEDLVMAFANGEDVYKIMASAIYGKAEEDITKDERFVGKTTILGAGYGMGAAKFQAQLKNFGVHTDLDECQRIISTYRETYEHVPELWQEAGSAIKAMIDDKTAPIGREGVLQVEGANGIRLPNGLYLHYPNLRERVDEETGKREFVYDTKKGRSVIPTRIYGAKCVAADTEVLTKRGWVGVKNVRLSDRVWDGVEWVEHEGLIYQGDKPTIQVDGVRMTQDHEILTTDGWTHASSCEGLYRADFWLPDGSEVFGFHGEAFTVGVPLCVRPDDNSQRYVRNEVREEGRDALLRVQGRDREDYSRYVSASGVLGMAQYARPVSFTYASSVEELRSPGDTCLPTVGQFVRSFLGGYGGYVPAGTDAGPHQQRGQLQPPELQVGTNAGSSEQPPWEPSSRPAESARDDGYTSVYAGFQMAPEPVYDLRNSGPRSRFVVRGASGPFIVHNCIENVCQALARIVIGEQMLKVARRYRPVMTVHDAIAVLAPKDTADEAQAYVEKCMKMRPTWGMDLPLNCEAGHGASYGECK